jgi:hypothetical protein
MPVQAAPSLSDGATHIQNRLLPLVNSPWKCPHRHTQRFALLISDTLLNLIKSIIKVDHHKLPAFQGLFPSLSGVQD